MRFFRQLLSRFSMQFLSRSSCIITWRVKTSGDFSAISVRFVAPISHMFRTRSNYLMQLGSDFWEIAANIAPWIAAKSPPVYICDKSCIGERGKNRIKNRMCKRAFTSLQFLVSSSHTFPFSDLTAFVTYLGFVNFLVRGLRMPYTFFHLAWVVNSSSSRRYHSPPQSSYLLHTTDARAVRSVSTGVENAPVTVNVLL